MNIHDPERALIAMDTFYQKPYTIAFCHRPNDWWMKQELAAKNAIYVDSSPGGTMQMGAVEFYNTVLQRIRGRPIETAYFVVCPKNLYTAELFTGIWKKLRKGGRIVIAHPDPDGTYPSSRENRTLQDVPGVQEPTSFNNAMFHFWQHTGIPVYRPPKLMDGRTVFIMKK